MLTRQPRGSSRSRKNSKTHLEYAQPTNAPYRCHSSYSYSYSCSRSRPRSRTRRLRRLLQSKDVPIEVRCEVERAFPRLEPAFVRARYEVRRGVDKRSSSPLVRFVQGAELEAHVEEVSSGEYVTVTVRSRERQRRV